MGSRPKTVSKALSFSLSRGNDIFFFQNDGVQDGASILRLAGRPFRTASTAVVQPAATSQHKCGKKNGAETTGCALHCEADERKFLEKHVCVLGRETQSVFAAVVQPRMQLEFRGRKFAYGQKRTHSDEIPNREDTVCRFFFMESCTKTEPFLFRNVVCKKRMVAKRTGSRQ